ncbi:hypothetical protein Hhel01_02568 [Haloferula helveola]
MAFAERSRGDAGVVGAGSGGTGLGRLGAGAGSAATGFRSGMALGSGRLSHPTPSPMAIVASGSLQRLLDGKCFI